MVALGIDRACGGRDPAPVNYKKRRPARSRGAAAMCWCNPHQKALGNGYRGDSASRPRLIERERRRDVYS